MSEENLGHKGAGVVSLADEEAVKQILVSSVFGLWDIVNNLTRLRPSRRERYRVTIFGSARARPGTYVYDEVKRIASMLAYSLENQCFIWCPYFATCGSATIWRIAPRVASTAFR